MIIHQLTLSVECYLQPVITSERLVPAQMGAEPPHGARPDISSHHPRPPARGSLRAHGAERRTAVAQGRQTRSVPAVGREGIVRLHFRRKGHYLAAWGASASPGLMSVLSMELGGALPTDRPNGSPDRCQWEGQDTAAPAGTPLPFAGY